MTFNQTKTYDEGTLTFHFAEGLNDLKISAISLIVNFSIIVLYSTLELFPSTRSFVYNIVMSYVFSFSILVVSVFGYFRMYTAINRLTISLKPANNKQLPLIKNLFTGYFVILILEFLLSIILGLTAITEQTAGYLFMVIFVIKLILYGIIFLLFSYLFKELGAIPGFNSRMLISPFVLIIATITSIIGRIFYVFNYPNNFWFYFYTITYLIYSLIVIGNYIELHLTIHRIDIEQAIHSLHY